MRGALLTCCSYSPETQSNIERVWRTIPDMSTALIINKKLPEQFWALTMRYACLIYNNIPPSTSPKRMKPQSPVETFGLRRLSIYLLRVFGCRCYANTDESFNSKNYSA